MPLSLRLLDASRPVHVVFVLGDGRTLAAEAYLQLLSDITRLAQSNDLLDVVRFCENVDAVHQQLLRRLTRTERALRTTEDA